jgi:hypothetical protein
VRGSRAARSSCSRRPTPPAGSPIACAAAPEDLSALFAEIAVLLEDGADAAAGSPEPREPPRPHEPAPLRLRRSGARWRSSTRSSTGFDQAIVVEGDGRHPMERPRGALGAGGRRGLPRRRRLARRGRASSALPARGARHAALGLGRAACASTPATSCAGSRSSSPPDDVAFDTEILIQCRALGVRCATCASGRSRSARPRPEPPSRSRSPTAPPAAPPAERRVPRRAATCATPSSTAARGRTSRSWTRSARDARARPRLLARPAREALG